MDSQQVRLVFNHSANLRINLPRSQVISQHCSLLLNQAPFQRVSLLLSHLLYLRINRQLNL
ncbi:hypothetical protein EON64_01875 [archaeon]|nr:MAG: hypothetical protein EON64_01875 [archaeon]